MTSACTSARVRRSRGAPLSIYEVHLGSWRRAADGGFLGYREAAHRLQTVVAALIGLFRSGGEMRRQDLDVAALVARHGPGPQIRQLLRDARVAALKSAPPDWRDATQLQT